VLKKISDPIRESFWSYDVFLMGGFSIVACLLFWAGVDKSSALGSISQLAFTLAFVMNHPHFLSSYLLLYGDFRSDILKKPRYFWSAVIVPFILGGSLLLSLATSNQQIMAHIITGMFFLVGWHYVKQVFGCVIVTSAQRKIFYSVWERRLLLTNLFATWFMSWLTNQVRYGDSPGGGFIFYGINHYRLNLPVWTLQATYWILGASLAGVIWMHVQRYVRTGVKPSPPGVAAFAALYAWYLPSLVHPAFAYFIPFFHSMQYLAFVGRLKNNQVQKQIQTLEGEEWRRAWINRFAGFFIQATILGALTFELIPKALDGQGWISGLGPTPFLASFLLFINIHHYFIDNAIWRSDNETVKENLFHSPSNESQLAIKRAA
jgi:hypothetical protein